MTFVDIIDDNNLVEDSTKDMLLKLLECAAEYENIDTEITEMSLSFVGKEEIQEINRDYRGKDVPTDVISFAYHETEDFNIGPYDTLGDIIISLERVEEQASEYNHSFEREFYYVLTHGILHILGYDHIEEDDKKLMREREEAILSSFGYTRDK